MKYFVPFVVIVFVICCSSPSKEPSDSSAGSQAERIDSIEKKTQNIYKPGLGEFMLNIQAHHAKLYFAGIYENWKLAGFEYGEINETIDDVRKYVTDRPETGQLGMIAPALDSIHAAIAAQDESRFKSAFTFLTASCNSCHAATHFEFNVIKVPDVQLPVVNQEFHPQK